MSSGGEILLWNQPDFALTLVDEEAAALQQPVARALVRDLDLDELAADLHAEAERVPVGGQPWIEAHLAVRVPQPGEAGHEREPGASARGDVDAIRGVAVR